MSNVKFTICTIKREKEIFEIVKKDLEFFKANNIRFTWPEKSIKEEYDLSKYKSHLQEIEKSWQEKENNFTERLLTFFYQPLDRRFTVEISNYGPLGFYDFETSTVTINLNTHLDVVETIKHEMVHILLEPFISKYKIEHNYKEYLVDTVLSLLKRS